MRRDPPGSAWRPRGARRRDPRRSPEEPRPRRPRTFCRRISGLYWKSQGIPVKRRGLLQMVLDAGVRAST
ncbi:hypothetical protein DV515_00000073 [Chloebia gouldiae]|uniref:Uncharacterized protein n=1 Tax=Chloebia gouldiae TaxID=44316 RepID=A0A3L8T292_CHLGU|nr:hypothetical protein DV515_00000073 [Chloebia gouldiae]